MITIDLPSASKTPRIVRCPASHTLPQAEEEAGEPAVRGIAIHTYLQNALEKGQEEALDLVSDEWRGACEVIDLDQLPARDPQAYRAEMFLAWNLQTNQFAAITQDTREKLDLTQWFVGRADVVAVSPDKKKVYVGDYKTGHGWLPQARDNMQMLSLALMAARAFKTEQAVIEILFVRDLELHHSKATLDTFDLIGVEEELRKLFTEIIPGMRKQGEPPIVMGPWCKYCPAFSSCHGQIKLINALASEPELAMEEILKPLAQGQAGIAYKKLKAAKMALQRAKEKLDIYAWNNPIDIGDGLLYGPATTSRDAVDGASAHQYLTENYGIAQEASEIRISKASIERALKDWCKDQDPKLKVAPEFRKIVEELRELGAIAKKASTALREHKKGK